MTTTYFKTKEQYFQFRTNFAAAANNTKSKSITEPCDEYLDDGFSIGTGSTRAHGWLRAEHFIFLNIIRGKPIHYGFTPVTNKNKLSNGGNIWQGLDSGVRRLKCAIHSAKDVIQIPTNASSQSGAYFREFIEPLVGGDEFLNVAYLNILVEIEPILEEHVEYYTTFGKGVKIAKKMIAEELKPKNYVEFMQIAEEIATNDTKKAA